MKVRLGQIVSVFFVSFLLRLDLRKPFHMILTDGMGIHNFLPKS